MVAASAARVAAGGQQQPGTWQAAAAALGADRVTSIEYTGTGKWHHFGQETNPLAPAPAYELRRYLATIDYTRAAKHVQLVGRFSVEPDRLTPVPHDRMNDEYVVGDVSWNVGPPGGAATGNAPRVLPDPEDAEERTMEIWATPHGFLRAAAANHATSRPTPNGGSEVTFMVGPHRFVGTINAQNQVQKVHTWIDNPVLGDMLCEAGFSEYRDFGGVMFPGRIVRTKGGKPFLDITVSSVRANPVVDMPVPAGMVAAMSAPVRATADKLADGVFWIKGGQWHSVAIEQADHIVVVDAPLDEARSLAVIAKAKEAIPNKPITYLVNTHAHFDHAGGLRTYVDEGAAIVTLPTNQAFYARAWRGARTLHPDRLARSGKTPRFEVIEDGKRLLADPVRPIQIYQQLTSGHSDSIVMVYLPVEKLLIEVDAWNTEAVNAPQIDTLGWDFVNPYIVDMYDDILRLKLDVGRIVPLHGPRTGTMAELRKAILLD
jgi:glyoxylase-like metal-dependent hydrolase (beta-lactamase superfamily II)